MDFDELRLLTIVRPLEVHIPALPVSVNAMWRNNGRGRVYKVHKASSWENAAVLITRRAAMEAWGTYDLSALKGYPLRLWVGVQKDTWFGKTKRTAHLMVSKGDLDNYVKSIFDALINGALYLGDYAIDEYTVKACTGPGEGVFVKLSFLPKTLP